MVPGLTPPLYRVFFNDPQEGGIFEAWLTSSVKNLGELFVASQAMVTHGLWKMKRGSWPASAAVCGAVCLICKVYILACVSPLFRTS